MKAKIAIALVVASILCSVALQARDALPWPSPDKWNTYASDKNWPLLHVLLETKTAYIQSGLPIQDSTVPEWITARYQPSPAETADLHVFIKHDDRDMPVNFIDGIEVHFPDQRIQERRGTIRILVTDKNNNSIFVVASETVGDAWAMLDLKIRQIEIAVQLQRKKEEKEQGKRDKQQSHKQ